MACTIFILVAQAGLTYANSNLFSPYITIPTGSGPEAVAIGDINSDGRNDVVMTTSYYFDPENDYKLFVFLQNALGILDPPVKYDTSGDYTTRPATVAIGDVNNDGMADVVVGNSGLNIEVFLQNGLGGLDPSQKYVTVDSDKIRIGDFNNDGLLDVVGIGWGTNTASVFLQNIGGNFNSPDIYSVTHGGWDDLDIGDINNDGLTDIVVMSGQDVYPNVGALTQTAAGTFNSAVFYDVAGNVLSSGVGVGDVNGDGLKDVVVTYGGNRPDSKIGIFLQNATGTLDPAISYNSYDIPEPVEIADVNRDGRQDILVAHGGWMALGVYLQSAGGTLASEELYPLPYASHYNPHGLAVGDVNGDDKNDIVIADYNNGLDVLYNQEGIPRISVSPASIDFGSIPMTGTSVQTVSITNIGNGDLAVTTVTLIGVDRMQYGIQNDNCSGTTLGPNDSCTLEVIFSPTTVGTKTAALHILSNDPYFPVVDVPLYGIALTLFHAVDYFPLDPGTIWQYLKNGQRAVSRKVLNKEVTVEGIKTRPVKYVEEHAREYYTSDSNGIFLHRQYQPHVHIDGVGWVDVDTTFIPPIKLADGDAWIGQSFHSSGRAETVVQLTGDIYNFNFSYTADSIIEAQETITVPAGTFDTVRHHTTFTINGITQFSTLYLAEGIGVVKDVTIDPQGKTSSFEMLSFTSLSLLAPNGGEIIPSGGTYDITWKSSPDMTIFRLSYSLNNGVTWIPISGAENVTENHYLWTVPITKKNKKSCRIKVSGYNDADIKVKEDFSDSPFTIEVVKVTSPDGSEVWTSDELRSITWMTNGTIKPVAKVQLSYSKNNGIKWHPITTIEGSNPGTYDWIVPSLTKAKKNCKVKVVLKDSAGHSIGKDISDQVFMMQP